MFVNRTRINYADLLNPLFIHPSDGLHSFQIGEKLIGSIVKRAMELYLSTKYKLLFVLGTFLDHKMILSKKHNGKLVIIWPFVGLRILFMKPLKNQCCMLSLQVRSGNILKGALKQNNSPVNECYINLRGMREELDAMCDLPQVVTITKDVTNFLVALAKQKDKHNLFQFLNGLDDKYTALSSQILIMNPLSTVEMACAMIQQE
ncbi:hypothetical protein Cgig2_000032 [Carnegiea gigantea]|uniref:Uncharacterized protein n=1 Tax=Carnegiea gigantea TaxID=171969 RepID=A0A9Q1QRA9_9CARY|nr:hypothetical protein Cgig2_000032 [Carnegiea gigantea]